MLLRAVRFGFGGAAKQARSAMIARQPAAVVVRCVHGRFFSACRCYLRPRQRRQRESDDGAYVDPWDEREDSAAPPVCGGSPPRSGGDDDDETVFDVYQRRILGVKRPRFPQAPTPPIPLQAPRRAPPSEWDEFSSGRALRPDLDRTRYERSIAGYRDTAIRLAQFSRALESVVALENELRDAARIELVAQLYDWSSDTIEQSRLRVAPVHNQLRWMHASDADLRALRLPRFYVPLRVLESQPAADRRRWPAFIAARRPIDDGVAAPGAL